MQRFGNQWKIILQSLPTICRIDSWPQIEVSWPRSSPLFPFLDHLSKTCKIYGHVLGSDNWECRHWAVDLGAGRPPPRMPNGHRRPRTLSYAQAPFGPHSPTVISCLPNDLPRKPLRSIAFSHFHPAFPVVKHSAWMKIVIIRGSTRDSSGS